MFTNARPRSDSGQIVLFQRSLMDMSPETGDRLALSNQIAIKPEPALPMSAWPQFERVLLSACQYIPGLGKVSASDRVRTAFQGSVWTMVGYGGSQLIRLASMVILARHPL